jgi:hypothetical protein
VKGGVKEVEQGAYHTQRQQLGAESLASHLLSCRGSGGGGTNHDRGAIMLRVMLVEGGGRLWVCLCTMRIIIIACQLRSH